MILVLNCGSLSIKYKIFDLDLNLKQEFCFRFRKAPLREEYIKTLEKILREIKSDKKIVKIGHRVVHGGEEFFEPQKIDKKTILKLKRISFLAPLHNPYNIAGIEIARKVFKNIPNFAVFDTGFFKNLPEVAKVYPLPKEILKKFKIRRFGFHGISHEYLLLKASEKLNVSSKNLNLITCHLGGGASICAIKKGKPIDISMGFTPLEGVTMMTRSGDVDPGLLIFLVKKLGAEKVEEILNKKSGILALAGTADMLEILDKAKKGNKKAKFALEFFVYRIKKYIGAYFVLLKNIDAIVFSGAIGSGKKEIRRKIIRSLPFKVKTLAIPTDEEWMIAKKIKEF